MHPPPLVSIITQLLDRGPKTPKQDALFDLRESMEPSLVPDFDQIAAQTHILDIMLTDVRAFVEYERELEKARMIDVDGVVQPVPMPIATGKKRTVLDVLINGLQLMHDGISERGNHSSLNCLTGIHLSSRQQSCPSRPHPVEANTSASPGSPSV